MNIPARRASLLLVLLVAWCPWALGADSASSAREEQFKAVREAAIKVLVRGPASVPLRDQATLALPAHFGFIPKKEAAALMSLMGNHTGDQFMGLIVPLPSAAGAPVGQWIVSLQYDSSGYVKDDDAKHWDADKLLQSLKDGTEAGNADRERDGIPPIMVTRWVQPPAYNADSRRLVWSAEVKRKDGADSDPTINYNTYVLGREGYISLNLVTSESTVDQDKVAAGQLLSAVDFNGGKRYADFKPSTDKVAAYGLAALVAGVAAKKLGLLALLGVTIVKFAKVIAIAVAAFGAGIARWFKTRLGRKEAS